jgi:hypothetical protein
MHSSHFHSYHPAYDVKGKQAKKIDPARIQHSIIKKYGCKDET